MTQWYGLFAPAGTPPDVVARLNHALNDVLTESHTRRRIESHGAAVSAGSPQELRQLVDSELLKWQRVVATSRASTPPAAIETAYEFSFQPATGSTRT